MHISPHKYINNNFVSVQNFIWKFYKFGSNITLKNFKYKFCSDRTYFQFHQIACLHDYGKESIDKGRYELRFVLKEVKKKIKKRDNYDETIDMLNREKFLSICL